MPTIVGLRFEDRLLELISAKTLKVGKLFEVDSLTLLLGKNGSGKTRLLTMIAEAVSGSGRSNTSIYLKGGGDFITLRRHHHNFAAIYYSGLPYRRKIKDHAGFIDASPMMDDDKSSHDQHGRMAKLISIAGALDVNVHLTAKLSYSKNIYRSVIIPELRSVVEYLTDSRLQALCSKLDEVEASASIGSEGVKDLDKKIEKCIQDISVLVHRYMLDHLPYEEHIHFLAAIEYLYTNNEEHDADYVISLLNYVGLVGGANHRDGMLYVSELVDRSTEAIRMYAMALEQSERAITFSVDGIEQFDAVRQYRTPIKVEWPMLSSGLQALIDQFACIEDAVAGAVEQKLRSIVLLIDEGDAFLHLDWQRQYITLLDRFLGTLKRDYGLQSLQVILATHSPIVAADIPGLFVTNLDDDEDSGIDAKTFGAPIEEVIAGSFESSALGAFAAAKINQLYAKMRKNKLTSQDRSLIDEIGDDAIRAVLKRGNYS
ncbi:hypothetical protein [Pseudomonas monteilii]|uniref:hypothetical protein n=1 Tax=Pseudomonas monteilii TaxID=76759 RepID=UPI0018A99881|nr:hypothetical protein [Pseudomonas monteilii]MBF8745348.1 hypothetical protein [Pseudomonas monteilii]